MNRRNFLRSLFASTTAIIVAPADVFDVLPPAPGDPQRTYFDMGRVRHRDLPEDRILIEWEVDSKIWRRSGGAPAFPLHLPWGTQR